MPGDVLEDLTADYADLRRVFSAYTGLPFHDPERKELVEQATAVLLRDAHIEAACLYPAVRELPDGERAVDQGLTEITEIEALLVELDRSDQDTPGFDRLVGQLAERATGHANREETQLFPALRALLPAEQLDGLSRQAAEERERAPRKPRPQAIEAMPPDDLPAAERPIRQRLRELLQRPPAPPRVEPAAAAPDLVEILLEQHVRIEGLFTTVEDATGADRQRAFDELRELLTVHEAGEDQVLRPVSRSAAGEEVASARVAEEQEAAQALAELTGLDIDGPEFRAGIAELREAVLAHARHEEKEEFPRVREHCSPEESAELGRRLLEAERTATRPGRMR